MNEFLEVENVSHKYGEREVLRNVSLAADEGQVTALVGANGSGKTTLLRIIAGLETPRDGRILIKKEPVEQKALRKRATMVFQRSVLFNASVYANLAYGLKVRGIKQSEIDDKVHMTLGLVGLGDLEERRARKLSGGEQQRVSLARALIIEPEILLLDEPTANIDPKNASIIESVITSANRQLATTILMASHNMAQAKRLADKVAVLQEGLLVHLGSANELLNGPSVAMENIARLENVFSGQAHLSENGTALIDIGHDIKLEATSGTGSVTVFVRPEEVIVSTMPLLSSARNVLKGRIVEATDWKDFVKLRVDVGTEFVATLTRKSFEEMKLNLGSDVYLTFKAHAVHVVS